MLFERFTKVEPILKGFSEDKKYCVTCYDGTKYLLRITPMELFEVRKILFETVEQAAALGVPMCKPIEFGTCTDGVYALHSWIDGEDLIDALPKLSEAEQYSLGVKSGEILQVIHSIPAPESQEDWTEQYSRKIDERIKKYRESEKAKFDGGEYFIKYIEQNRDLLDLTRERVQCFQHGDYHVHNMMLENGSRELKIIYFGKLYYSDPWEELFKTIFSAQISPHFATGQLDGYFDGEPPLEFFRLNAFYISSRVLLAIEWAIQHGKGEVDFILKLISDTLNWHDNMNNPVPSWYLKNYK